MLSAHNTRGELDISSRYSFPLCRLALDKNAPDEARFQMIGNQFRFFSKYMGNQAIIQNIKKNWLGAISHIIPNKDKFETRHIVLLFSCGVPREFKYFY